MTFGKLVQRHCDDRGGLVESDPDIGEDDNHQRRQIEQHDQPWIGIAVDGFASGPWRSRAATPSVKAMANAPTTRASV